MPGSLLWLHALGKTGRLIVVQVSMYTVIYHLLTRTRSKQTQESKGQSVAPRIRHGLHQRPPVKPEVTRCFLLISIPIWVTKHSFQIKLPFLEVFFQVNQWVWSRVGQWTPSSHPLLDSNNLDPFTETQW